MEQPHPSAFSSYQDLLGLGCEDIWTLRTHVYTGVDADDWASETCRASCPWFGWVTSFKFQPRSRRLPTENVFPNSLFSILPNGSTPDSRTGENTERSANLPLCQVVLVGLSSRQLTSQTRQDNLFSDNLWL